MLYYLLCSNYVVIFLGMTVDHGLGDKLVVQYDTRSTIILTVISGIGIPSNIIALIVILNSPIMRRKLFNMFIIHQSLIDLMACLSTLLLQYFHDASAVTVGKGMLEKMLQDFTKKMW